MRPFPAAALASLAALLPVFVTSGHGHEAVGGDVRLVSTINAGGVTQTNGNVLIVGFVGEPGVVASSGDVVARQGGNGSIYYPASLAIFPEATSINEQGAANPDSTRTQLRGVVTYDDATLGAVAGDQIAWHPPAIESGLASISPSGVAQAAAVYQNMNTAFSANYLGLGATNTLQVLNVLPDNYGVWAGDTFDDAWEIGQGMTGAVNPDATNNGVPNWQLYAMGFNPQRSAPAALASAATTGGFLTIRYTRNPYATNYVFTPQESGNLPAGFTNMVNPVSVTNLSDGVEHIVTRGSTPLNATNRQFLRVRISKP